MDFGDVIFFLIFVGIIISNIVKQIKKAQQKEQDQSSGKQKTGKTGPDKKAGWKDLLNQMLEEAQRQMEIPAEGQAKQPPEKAPTGWESIVGEREAAPRRPAESPAPTPKKPRPPRKPKPSLISETIRKSKKQAPDFKSVAAAHQSRPPVTKFKQGEDRPRDRERAVPIQATSAVSKVPRSLPLKGLQSAVVWAEILGPPRALRDLET